jgi:crossover junction endodeoxyribonuclease RuvC
MVQKLLKLPELPEPPDAADALAIAICHLHTASTLRSQRAHVTVPSDSLA